MKIFSERFKTDLEFDDNMIIQMPFGIPGFLNSKRFCILEMGDEDAPFKWLHDVDNTNICLLITDPYQFFPEYKPEFNQAVIDELNIKNIETDLTIFAIVKITSGGKEAFANLRAPVVVNAVTKNARQIILDDEKYSVKTALFIQQNEQQEAVNG